MNRLIPSTLFRPIPLTQDFERLLQDFWSQVPAGDAAPVAPFQPAVNIRGDAEGYEVELELPGVALADIEVAVEQRELIVRGERKAGVDSGAKWQRRERFHGRFERRLRLPADVDAQRVDARLELGVLTIALPKLEQSKPRRIQVQTVQPS